MGALFLHQLRGEQLLFWRSRESAFFTFAFPILLLALIMAFYTGRIEGAPAGRVLLAGMLGYGAAMTAFAGLAITLVVRRENGVLKRLRATPLPPATYVATLLGSTVIVFALETVCMIVVARFAYHVGVPSRLGSLALALLLTAASFAALGVAISSAIRSAEGSSAVINIIVLPMAFLSGSFGSTANYPHFLRVIADVLPLTYAIRLVRAVVIDGQPFWDRPGAIAVVAAWGAAGALVAARRFRWTPREG